MKKLLTLTASALALAALPAMAQVFPSPNHKNSAMITQNGNLNEATVDQAVGGIINGQAMAEIIQSSNRGRATITQTSATSPRPGGFANMATIEQRRVRSTATIDQIHDYNPVFGNEAIAFQVAADAAASIQQRGDQNFANVRQLNSSVLPVASVQQNGTNNRSIIRQRGSGGFVVVNQGDFTSAAGASPVTSRGRATIDNEGVNADIFVTQIGVGHVARVFEDGINGLTDISMYGDFNTADVIQESTNGVIAINTYGLSANNTADVFQEASDFGSVARIDQSGRFGAAEINQKDTLGGGGNNLAEIDQSGIGSGASDLYSLIVQNGGNNQAQVSQASAYAQSSVAQMGIGHTALVSQ